MEPTKRIKILTPGLISVLGGIYGPILTPYFEKESVIFKLVAAGIKVVEVLENGKEVAISVTNFKADNDDSAKKSNKKPEKKAEPKVEDKVETLNDETGEDGKVPAEIANENPAVLVTEDTDEEKTIADVVTAEEVTENNEEIPAEEGSDVIEPEVQTPSYNNYNKHNKNNKKR